MPTPREQVKREVVPDGGVVVGDDGSRNAARAIVFAHEEAQRRGTGLHVIRAWVLTSAVRPDDCPPGITPSLVEFEAATLAATQKRADELLGKTDVQVTAHVTYGPSAQGLVKASETADIVVVGSRGRGGFANLMLGSVADQVVRFASCPVVVVPLDRAPQG